MRFFAAVARHLSFAKAEQAVFVSQPVVTKHMRERERRFYRKSRKWLGTTCTPLS
ncbi:MAG: helix-turn-helix domain-containing protein [Janthinobacterium lividum]